MNGVGKANCTWTSCKMGCTSDEVFTCQKILVDANPPKPDQFHPSFAGSRLMVNAVGCSYSSCVDWVLQYKVGLEFSCHISWDGKLAVSYASKTKETVLVAISVLPLFLSILSLWLMYHLYWRRGALDSILILGPNTVQMIQQVT